MPQLDSATEQIVRELVSVWRRLRPRNLTRTIYYEGEAALKDFGISLPPKMKSIASTLGWSKKGVHAVTDRSQFEGFVGAADDGAMRELEDVLTANDFYREFAAAKISSAVHGCAFLAVRPGFDGEPPVVIMPVAADMCAALWDPSRRTVEAFLHIVDVSTLGMVKAAYLYLPGAIMQLVGRGGAWDHGFDAVAGKIVPFGEVSVAPMPYQYELGKPFGHSRITRASMRCVDSAIRTIVRAEVSSEFYSVDKFWLFGANVEAFVGTDRWNAFMGRVNALNVEEGAQKPDLHHSSGASPQPHVDQLRMWAKLFSDDQSMPDDFTDSVNPASADAIYAKKETLIVTTRSANTGWERAAVHALKLAAAWHGGITPAMLDGLYGHSTKPDIVSPTGRADSFSKLAANIPGFAESEVGLEYAGLSRDQIIRFQRDQRRMQMIQLRAGVAAAAGQSNAVVGG